MKDRRYGTGPDSQALSGAVAAEEIQKMVRNLGHQISRDYSDAATEDSPLVILCVLRGAFMFTADLVRHITVPIQIEFIRAASYQGMVGGEYVHLHLPFPYLKNRDVLIVEDVIDTGNTAKKILEHIRACDARSIRLCALLSKPVNRKHLIRIDYEGCLVDDIFVVGYGLDYNGLFRNLSGIYGLGQDFRSDRAPNPDRGP